MRKLKTIAFDDFMSGEYKRKQSVRHSGKSVIGAIGGTAATALIAHPTFAATPGQAVTVGASADITAKIMHAFDPLVNLIVGLSIPIASVIIAGAALMIMIGQKERGYTLLMNCAVGYVLVQMTPLFITLLSSVGASIVGLTLI